MAKSRIPFFRRTFRITRVQPDVSRDVAEEIDFHLDMRTEELIEQGVAPEVARRRAASSFGARREIEAECLSIDEPLARKRRRSELFAAILGDLQRAGRDLWRRPILPLAACLTLAVCIALNTATFAVVNSILLAPLPFPDSDRLVGLYNMYPKAGFPRLSTNVPEYFDRRAAVSAFEEVALYQYEMRSVGEPGAVKRTACMAVTPSFFRALRVEPLLGRTFTEGETEPGAGDKAVLSFGTWQSLFAGDPSVVGRQIRVEGVNHTVIGVMPEGYSFPGWRARLWLPVTFTEEQKSIKGRYHPLYEMLALLAPGVTIEQAQKQLDAWNQRLLEQLPSQFAQLMAEGGFETRIVDYHDDLVRDVESWLYLLWGGAVFVLLIGGISLTNLLLVRSIGRLRELTTRYVLGASRARLARHLLTESLLLALVGGGLGILAGVFSLRLLDSFHSLQIPRVGEVELDPVSTTLILLLAVSVMAVSTSVSILAVWRRDPYAILKAGGATPGRGPQRLRGVLVAAQIAVAFILLTGAALMSVSLWKLL